MNFELVKELLNYTTYDNREKESVEYTLKFIKNNKNCFDRSNLEGHITAGALVCDDKGNILLNHHKKSGMWFQFGGHSDGEKDSLNVAKREVMEEAGIVNFSTNGKIFDVSVMKIPFSAKKNEPEHRHYDINFLFIVKDKNYEVSNESMDIKWVTIGEAKQLVDQSDVGMQRMIKKYNNLLQKVQ